MEESRAIYTARLLVVISLIFISSVIASAEQVTWDNDTAIRIQDNWKGTTGLPLSDAKCNITVFSFDGVILHEGPHTELAPGVFNFTVSQITVPGIYPMIINCSKSGYNGTSSKDSIKIVDELTEDFKDSIDQTNLTVIEINDTTHMTYDLLSGQINDTLQEILNTTNFTKANLTGINQDLDTILSNSEILVDKWGYEDADRIVDLLKDLRTKINTLEFRFKFVSDGELDQRTSSILTTANAINNQLKGDGSEKDINLSLWAFWIFIAIIVLILIIYFANKKNG